MCSKCEIVLVIFMFYRAYFGGNYLHKLTCEKVSLNLVIIQLFIIASMKYENNETMKV